MYKTIDMQPLVFAALERKGAAAFFRPGSWYTIGMPRPRGKHMGSLMQQHAGDGRVQHELKEMQETHDLRNIDDDVEDVATLFAWEAPEHAHRPKSPRWFVALAVAVTVLVGFYLFSYNFIGALTTALVGGLLYWIAQRKPAIVAYRIMVDGVAIGTMLYHFRDLAAFNIVYEPDETRTVILRSRKHFTPLLHMEIGEVDPVAIRDILIEFLPEDQNMQEPLVDILARRLGF